MDQNSVYQLFVATYHQNPNVHKQAELTIRSIESQMGFLPIVLQILASENLEPGARQAAAIYFKNRMNKAWDKRREAANPINNEDRDVIKKHILEALVTAPGNVGVQLTSSLNTVISCDFPEEWPQFKEYIGLLLQGDKKHVAVGLSALREVSKVYRWKTGDSAQPLHDLITQMFPAVQKICNMLVNNTDDEDAEMLKLALKTYHCAIYVEMPTSLQEQSSLVAWGNLFLQLVEKPIPNEALPEDLDDRDKFPWWKTKKWAYHCLNRLFSKYGNPALLQPSASKSKKDFAKQFVHSFAPNILQSYLNQVERWIKKEIWVPSKCLALIAAFLGDSIKHKVTWQIMKPHTDILVQYFIFPQLCLSEEDLRLWEDDPVEYVHKIVDPYDDFHSAQTNVTNLLIDLVHDRKKYTFMNILGFINGVLNKYLETSENEKDGKEKDGALCMIACLSHSILHKKSPVANMMEPFFVTHVFPEFKSRFPYLRARACDMAKHFSDLDFAIEQNLATLYQNVIGCLRDEELPVKVQAALALRPMIRHESVRDAMAPNLPFIMKELLELTNQIDVDTLSNTMEKFVEVFAEQLTPFAVELCTQLRDTFLRIMEDVAQANVQPGGNDIDDDTGSIEELSDRTMAAMGVLKTIGTLILSLEGTPEILQQLEDALLPVFTYTLENQIVDLYDEIFEIIDSCTFSAKRVTATMWSVFRLIYNAFKISGIDYIEGMLAPLDNYISYGTEVFISNSEAQHMVFDIIETVMKSDRLGENDRVCACKLIESVLLNCRGRVDSYLPQALHLAFQYIFTNMMKTTEFKVHCIEVVVNCLYYNPRLTLGFLEESHWTHNFFTLWFGTLDKFSRVHDKKLAIVALCEMLRVFGDSIPPSLEPIWPQILQGIVEVFKTLPKAVENRAQLEKSFGEDFYESSGFEGSVDEDEDEDHGDEDVPDEDSHYLEYLAQKAAEHADDFDYDEDEIEEELLFESPLDEVDPYGEFEKVFRTMQQANPPLYTLLTQGLDNDQQQLIMSVLTKAEQNRTKQQLPMAA